MLKVVTLLSTLRDPTQLRRRQCATRKMYANRMQKICINYAKSIQNLCKKDSHALHNHIYMDYAGHGEIQGRSLALGTWRLALAAQKKFG